MSIRRILVIAFLLVSLVPAAVLTLLAFVSGRDALLAEIRHNLELSAAAVSAEIDEQLFERLLNATTWNHLEVMEDLRLGDVDKRLSRFLAETKEHHGGIYIDIHALDPQGRVVASSRPLAIGQTLHLPPHWMDASLPNERVTLHHPQPMSAATPSLTLRSDIASLITEQVIGTLVLEVDWRQIEAVLDRSATQTRQVLLIDADGRVAAASSALRAKGITHGNPAEGWRPLVADATIETRDHVPGFDGPVIAGYQRSQGFDRFGGTGWTFVLLQSRADAMAPVQRMAWVFAGLMAALAAVVVLVSLWIAGVISRPIIALTEFTRRYLQPGPAPLPPAEGPGEVGELTRSFTRMVEDLQQSQRTLTQASKLAALGEITALLAHEVRTPLGILKSSAQVLSGESGLSGEGKELLQIISSETERLNRLVSSMLDSTRTRPLARVPTDLHGLIAHTTMLLSAQMRDRGIQVRIVTLATHAMLDCDPEQITQALLNLMMNAMHILPRGGHIEVTTREEPQRLIVEIADNGPGIAEDLRGQLFEPFVYKREGGLGLGLAVVRTIIRNHGGDVVAESSALGGALFRISLPMKLKEGIAQ